MKRKHRQLAVWSGAMDLVEQVYRLSSSFPKEEAFALTAQMRRAAISVPSNPAEGAARSTTKELAQFVSISLGSLSELDAQLEIATRLGYCRDQTELQSTIDEVSGQLVGLRASLRRRLQRGDQLTGRRPSSSSSHPYGQT